jgi:hypothetical protein
MKRPVLLACGLSVCLSSTTVHAQKVGAYLQEMERALLPLGLVDASNCHNVRVYSPSTLGAYALAVGIDEKGEPRFNIYAADSIESDIDLAALDEDRVKDFAVVSGAELAKHRTGDPWTNDKAAVLIPSSSPRKQITVHAVDVLQLERRRAAGNQVSESDLKAMNTNVEERMAVNLLFSDKDSADKFVNALKKAIVVCKAQ